MNEQDKKQKTDASDEINIESLDGEELVKLLIEQPQLADKCDWSKLGGDDWASLLVERPQFADKCDWGKMRRRLEGHQWVRLLENHPEFAEHCKWSKLSGRDWVRLLLEVPQFAEQCDWEVFKARDWASLLESHPEFADKCCWDDLREGLAASAWECLLKKQPQFADKCDGSNWSGHGTCEFLLKNPQLACRCDLAKLDGDDWAKLLAAHPEFADKCDWSKLSGWNWASLLRRQPRFADRCDWGKPSLHALAYLFAKRPELCAVAKEKRGILGKIFHIQVIPEELPCELGRVNLKPGEVLTYDPYGVIGNADVYADGTPGGTKLVVRLDGETLVEQEIDFSNPQGLAFVDQGDLFDETPPENGQWLYGASVKEEFTWSGWVMEVPADFSFDPGKLVVPFVHARAGASESQLWIHPCDIRYGDLKPDDTAFQHQEDNQPTYAIEYWTIERGVPREYNGLYHDPEDEDLY